MKIKRDTFLYMEGDDSDFAQCGSCSFGADHCSLMDGAEVDAENGSCNLYVEGDSLSYVVAELTKEEVGYVERPVRCENCKFSRPADRTWRCRLYERLTRLLPDLFDLDADIKPHGCCNAQQPK